MAGDACDVTCTTLSLGPSFEQPHDAAGAAVKGVRNLSLDREEGRGGGGRGGSGAGAGGDGGRRLNNWNWSGRWDGHPATLDTGTIASLVAWEERESRFAPFADIGALLSALAGHVHSHHHYYARLTSVSFTPFTTNEKHVYPSLKP